MGKEGEQPQVRVKFTVVTQDVHGMSSYALASQPGDKLNHGVHPRCSHLPLLPHTKEGVEESQFVGAFPARLEEAPATGRGAQAKEGALRQGMQGGCIKSFA